MEISHAFKQNPDEISTLSGSKSTHARSVDRDGMEHQGATDKAGAAQADGANLRNCRHNSILQSGVSNPVRHGISSCASEPQLWRSHVRLLEQQQQQEQQHSIEGQTQRQQQRRKSAHAQAGKTDAEAEVILREACMQDLPLIRKLMKRHLRSLILPAVFYWLCCHTQDFGSFLLICCCFAPLTRVLMSLICFLLLLLVRVVLELEQYAARGCPDLANFEVQYLKADRNKFWVAERTSEKGKGIIGCIGLLMPQGSPQDGQLVRLVVAPGHRGVGVGSRLLSAALGFAASCRCRSVEVCANSLNASSARFLRNRQFELVQVVKRNLMRGDLLRWRLCLDSEGRPIAPKPEFTFGGGDLQPE
ncbi:hypothetical protein ACSSS7_005368 [Eimeria intestinalis]